MAVAINALAPSTSLSLVSRCYRSFHNVITHSVAGIWHAFDGSRPTPLQSLSICRGHDGTSVWEESECPHLLTHGPLSCYSRQDVITLNFFFLVRDNGSWLEIGTSISHFVIASTFEVLSVLLFGLSSLLVSGVHIGSGVGGRQQKAVAVGKKGR